MKKINIAIAFMLLISLVYSPVHADEVKEVYLTFDDGPSHNTPQVLDILDKYNVKATFFVTGENARYQSYIRTAYLKGHAIGAHSYTHKYSIYQSEETYFVVYKKRITGGAVEPFLRMGIPHPAYI